MQKLKIMFLSSLNNEILQTMMFHMLCNSSIFLFQDDIIYT